MWASLAIVACREDLALVTGLAAAVAFLRPSLRAHAKWVGIGSAAWLLLFVLVLHPLFAPAKGSMLLHFGRWGETVPEAALGVLTSPALVWDHLTESRRLAYPLLIVLPLGGLSLLGWRFALLALPLLVVNVFSDWPTTTSIDSHYTMGAVPMLVAAAVDAVKRLSSKWHVQALLWGWLMSAALLSHVAWGQTPLSVTYERGAFVADARSRAAADVVAAIPRDASVQAPYSLMAHLAERSEIAPPPPPERNYDYVVFDAWHRDRFWSSEDLLRTAEEPNLRDWLARSDHELALVRRPFFLLRRGGNPRGGEAGRYLVGRADPSSGVRLARCLRLRGAQRDQERLVLDLVSTQPCPSDLAIRLGPGRRPSRVDLLFDGLLNPAHLREGDRLVSRHRLGQREISLWERGEGRIGVLRSSGARPEHADPMSVPVWLSR